jgi:hypothetical protein
MQKTIQSFIPTSTFYFSSRVCSDDTSTDLIARVVAQKLDVEAVPTTSETKKFLDL